MLERYQDIQHIINLNIEMFKESNEFILKTDIAFATKECAVWMHEPTELHSQMLKRIARYLIGRPRCVHTFVRQDGGQKEGRQCKKAAR